MIICSVFKGLSETSKDHKEEEMKYTNQVLHYHLQVIDLFELIKLIVKVPYAEHYFQINSYQYVQRKVNNLFE